MKPHFLFPVSPLNNRIIDEEFQDQAIALKLAGFATSAYDIDENRIIGAQPEPDAVVVLRGWMMTPPEYAFWCGWVMGKGHKPLTDPEQYIKTHHLPNWYESLRGITPETIFPTDPDSAKVAEEINATGWSAVFIKDYVKSLKTDEKPILETPVTADAFMRIMEKMRKYRGFIEGGAVVRQYENYYPNTEKRYFVINGRFYGQDVSFDTRAMNLLARAAREIPAPFFSVDIAERIDGTFRIIELGDGQVSDLVGWTYERFAEIWK